MGTLLQVIENLSSYVGPLSIFLFVLSFVIGVGLAIAALKGAAKRSEMGPSAGTWSTPMWTFIIAICFLALPGFILSISISFFGAEGTGSLTNPQSIFEHAPETVGLFDEDSPGRDMITAIVTVVMLVGLIAVMRGLFLLNESAKGQGPKTFGPGMTFVIAGVMGLNFPIFVGVMETMLVATPPP
ncbi:MAG: hypothetical protein ABJN42_18025 [Roseibium sp.]|uniref:hypothetical protein n=1 Tax=Roseibium sp. TaxID=1936156 RepID=UPI003298C703